MTQLQLNITSGRTREDVTVSAGSAIGSSLVRVLIDDANVDLGTGFSSSASKKGEVLKALDMIRERLIREQY